MCVKFLVAILILLTTHTAIHSQTVADICRDGYIQTRLGISSLSCDSTSENYQENSVNPYGIVEPAQVFLSKYTWKECNGMISCTENTILNGQTAKQEFLFRDGMFKRIDRNDQSKNQYGQFFDHTGQYHSFSIWRDGFLESNHEAVERLKTKPLKYEGIELISGDPCHKISMDQGNATEYFWFDPKKNYLIRRTQYHPNYNKKIYFEREVEKFIEPKPGVWFPSQTISRQSRSGKMVIFGRTTFRNVVVNGPIPDSTFQLKFPVGTKVTDNRAGTYYVVGENEEPVGPVIPKAVPRNLSPAEVQMPTGVSLPGQSEGTPTWVWAVVGASVLATSAIGYGLWWRRRAG